MHILLVLNLNYQNGAPNHDPGQNAQSKHGLSPKLGEKPQQRNFCQEQFDLGGWVTVRHNYMVTRGEFKCSCGQGRS